MYRFFVNRPIVSMVISIITVIVGAISMLALPIAQYPNIVPPEIYLSTVYPGADALTIEQSVATPIEQQMSGVDNMNYMYSLNTNSGQLRMYVNFDVSTDANTDQILSQMRLQQAMSQLPAEVNAQGVTVVKSTTSPLIMFAIYSPKATYDGTFLANYSYINMNDAFTRVKGISQVQVFGADKYAMRLWVRPDQLAKLNITVPEIVRSIKEQNTVNPSGQIGGEPIPEGQEFTYAARAQGRLQSEEEFAAIVVRANTDGSVVRVGDVARVELGSQSYNTVARLNHQPAALVALYQLPGSNAVQAAAGCRKLMEELKARFPPDLDYVVALDTTLAVTAGIEEIIHTFVEALILVIIVVFVFLQGWRATLIPLLAVPVSLIGTFALFPLLGFTINTISLFGMVLAIGLVVDDAIVVVEAVEHHIEKGLAPKEATLKAMSEVAGPVAAIAVILAAVFLPTAFIPGITGRLYQQFAVTIAVSMAISAFNALTLSPALAALLLKPKGKSRGPLGFFYKAFNRVFGVATEWYVRRTHNLIRIAVISILGLVAVSIGAGYLGKQLPPGFLPEEDQGYLYGMIQLPSASSLQRTNAVLGEAEQAVMKVPGVQSVASVAGFSLLSNVQATYNGFFFITLKPWHDRKAPEEQYAAIKTNITRALGQYPQAIGFAFPPPAIPGIGTSGGVSFILQDRAGKDIAFLAENTDAFLAAARKRPELVGIATTALLSVPQVFVDVDRDKVLRQGIAPADVYQTMQAFMGGLFVNYFNKFGRQWQVYLQAEGDFRTRAENLGQFYVRNSEGGSAPLSALTSVRPTQGPEFTMRFNLYRSVQIMATPAPGVSSLQAMKALEEVFAETMPPEMGFDYIGMSYQEKKAQEGIPSGVVFGISILFVFLILAALYESWTLPFSVLLSVPIAIAGAFGYLLIRKMDNNIYAQIGLVTLIGLAAKNAILIVEFARAEFHKGATLLDASLAGARTRLRPILMTSFAFGLGCVPLAIATGAGNISRQVMGTTVIGGIVAATFVAIFIIPVLYYGVERITGSKRPAHAVAAIEAAKAAGTSPPAGGGH